MEGKHGQNLTHGYLARIDRGTQTTPVLDRDRDPLVFHPLKHRIGNEVAHRAFGGPTDRPVSVDRHIGRGDDALLHLFDRSAHIGDSGRHVGIRRDRGIQKHRITRGRDHIALIVKGDGQLADIFGIGIGLGHRAAIDHGRVGEAFAVIDHFCMAMSANDDIDGRDGLGNGEILGQTDMVQRDDDVDAFGFQCGCISSEAFDFVLKDDPVTRARGVDRVFGQGRDDADFLAAHLEHHVVLHLVGQQRLA